MFYCEPCASKNQWPFFYGMPTSRGPCECCGKTASCADVPSSALPAPKPRKATGETA